MFCILTGLLKKVILRLVDFPINLLCSVDAILLYYSKLLIEIIEITS